MADKYDSALAQAKIDPSKLNKDQRDAMRTLQSEHSSRGREAREALK